MTDTCARCDRPCGPDRLCDEHNVRRCDCGRRLNARSTSGVCRPCQKRASEARRSTSDSARTRPGSGRTLGANHGVAAPGRVARDSLP